MISGNLGFAEFVLFTVVLKQIEAKVRAGAWVCECALHGCARDKREKERKNEG